MRDSDFLSIVSHELRTPITVIVGLAATLANRRERLTQEQVDDCLAYRYGGPAVRLEAHEDSDRVLGEAGAG